MWTGEEMGVWTGEDMRVMWTGEEMRVCGLVRT